MVWLFTQQHLKPIKVTKICEPVGKLMKNNKTSNKII